MKWIIKKASYYIVSIVLVITTPLAFANNTEDSKEPIEITSNTGSFDNKKGVALYTGNVKVTQGSRLLTSDNLELQRNAAGDASKFIAKGKPARYQSKTSPDKPLLYAQADTIEYDVQKQVLYLIGNARVEQGGDVYSAPRIEYNQKDDIVNSPRNEQGRTTIIIQPRENKSNIPSINPTN